MSVAPTWLSGEGWRLPGSGIEGLYSSELALDVARRAEAAHLDFVFRPDAHFLPMSVMDQSFGFSSLDPTLLMASIARETSKIGLMTTIHTTFGPPYHAARQLMSLHWLSNGRAGWNVVTAYVGNENFGFEEMPSSEARYARAREFVDVVRRLWDSFPSRALLVDREGGHYADTELIQPINHRGAHFTVAGPMNLPQYPGPRIPLMQAGGSAPGVDLAGSIADMVFAQTPDMQAALTMRRALSARAVVHYRRPSDVLLLPGLSLYLGQTRQQARDLFMATHHRMTRAQRAARVRDASGLDLTDWPDDKRIGVEDLPRAAPAPRLRAQFEMLRALLADRPTVAQLLARPEVLASVHWQVIGTVADAVAEIARWFDAGAIDGFIAVPGGARTSLILTLEELIPRLAEAGLFRDRYSGTTFMEHLEEN